MSLIGGTIQNLMLKIGERDRAYQEFQKHPALCRRLDAEVQEIIEDLDRELDDRIRQLQRAV